MYFRISLPCTKIHSSTEYIIHLSRPIIFQIFKFFNFQLFLSITYFIGVFHVKRETSIRLPDVDHFNVDLNEQSLNPCSLVEGRYVVASAEIL